MATEKSNSISKKSTIDLLVGAFEGGSNYWIEQIKKKQLPIEINALYMPNQKFTGNNSHKYLELDKKMPVPKEHDAYLQFKKDTGYHGVYDTILNDGELEICSDQGCKSLSMTKIQKKIPKFKKAYPQKWKRIKEQQEDAEDSDAFLQYILFDDIIFG